MSKIGVITEGRAERVSLQAIMSNIDTGDISIINPIYTSIEPKARPGQIAKAAEAKVNILIKKGCDKIIVILDQEDNNQCIVERAIELNDEFKKRGQGEVIIVIKNRQFENWLIADPEAVNQTANFRVTQAFRSKARNADNVSDPVGELQKLKRNKKRFDKSSDCEAIAKKCNPLIMATNSRSFRKFLKELTTIE